jgi:signal transduction histidine kinase
VVEPLGQVWGDPTAIEQLFANLVQNALAYLHPERRGRIAISVRDDAAPPPEIDRVAGRVRTFTVADNGVGIAAGHVAKVFVAFQRLQPQLAEGEGIGLTLVRRILDRHGGQIWVESTEGAGSTFFVSLPVEPPEQSSTADHAA